MQGRDFFPNPGAAEGSSRKMMLSCFLQEFAVGEMNLGRIPRWGIPRGVPVLQEFQKLLPVPAITPRNGKKK